MAEDTEDLAGDLALKLRYADRGQVDRARRSLRKRREMGETIELYDVFTEEGFLSADQSQDLKCAVEIRKGRLDLVSGYEVIGELGRGGMGVVYKARRISTAEMVALKILPPSLATGDHVARFKRESEIVSGLDHDNIVRCVEFGYDMKRRWHFCALELVDGEDLGEIIDSRGPLAEAEAVSIATQVAEALDHASSHGLIHRDVKPENVMVARDGRVKLLDLGLARPADAEATRLTQSGLFMGTPCYASPEQATGERDVDVRSDIYSLGATLYHMVTGKPPFEAPSAMRVLHMHMTEPPPWPRDANPELSEALCRTIHRMMAKDPSERHQSARDLVSELERLGRKRGPGAGDEVMKFEHRGRVQSVAYSPDGSLLASGCDDRRAVLWDTRTGKCVRTFDKHGGSVWAVAFSSDGRFLAAGCSDRNASVWEVGLGRKKWLFDTRRKGVTSVAFSPDGLFLATGGADGGVLLWDMQFGLEAKEMARHLKPVWSVAFSPSGLVLATGGDDGKVHLSDVNSGGPKHTLEAPCSVFSVAFSPDGRRLATGHGERSGDSWGGSAYLWDVETGDRVGAFEEQESAVRSVAFSPDGGSLATCGYDNCAALWDLGTGERSARFSGHTSWVWAVAVSPCGRRLATGSSDRTVRVWLIGPEAGGA